MLKSVLYKVGKIGCKKASKFSDNWSTIHETPSPQFVVTVFVHLYMTLLGIIDHSYDFHIYTVNVKLVIIKATPGESCSNQLRNDWEIFGICFQLDHDLSVIGGLFSFVLYTAV